MPEIIDTPEDDVNLEVIINSTTPQPPNKPIKKSPRRNHTKKNQPPTVYKNIKQSPIKLREEDLEAQEFIKKLQREKKEREERIRRQREIEDEKLLKWSEKAKENTEERERFLKEEKARKLQERLQKQEERRRKQAETISQLRAEARNIVAKKNEYLYQKIEQEFKEKEEEEKREKEEKLRKKHHEYIKEEVIKKLVKTDNKPVLENSVKYKNKTSSVRVDNSDEYDNIDDEELIEKIQKLPTYKSKAYQLAEKEEMERQKKLKEERDRLKRNKELLEKKKREDELIREKYKPKVSPRLKNELQYNIMSQEHHSKLKDIDPSTIEIEDRPWRKKPKYVYGYKPLPPGGEKKESKREHDEYLEKIYLQEKKRANQYMKEIFTDNSSPLKNNRNYYKQSYDYEDFDDNFEDEY